MRSTRYVHAIAVGIVAAALTIVAILVVTAASDDGYGKTFAPTERTDQP